MKTSFALAIAILSFMSSLSHATSGRALVQCSTFCDQGWEGDNVTVTKTSRGLFVTTEEVSPGGALAAPTERARIELLSNGAFLVTGSQGLKLFVSETRSQEYPACVRANAQYRNYWKELVKTELFCEILTEIQPTSAEHPVASDIDRTK